VRARRPVLRDVPRCEDTHAGLWMDKFLQDQTTEDTGRDDDAKRAKGDLLAEVASIGVPAPYATAFARRKLALESSGRYVIQARARAVGRAVVGLGQKGPTEIGICLEHTWGVPILPGSSLKGVAAAAAHRLHGGAEWEKATSVAGKAVARKPNSYDWLFGTTDEEGAVSFLDAWLDPDTKHPLDLDVMTVHHQKYYGGDTRPSGDRDVYPPSDMDSPNPVAFLSTGGTFVVFLEGEEAWVETAFKLLSEGLEQLGIGAKTNAGYGRFVLERVRSPEQLRKQKEAELAAKREKELEQTWRVLDGLPARFKGAQTATDNFAELLKAEKAGCPEERLRALARLLAGTAASKAIWRKWGSGEKRRPEQKLLFDRIFKPLF
jgi:CRISPR-associated protein Cmr6